MQSFPLHGAALELVKAQIAYDKIRQDIADALWSNPDQYRGLISINWSKILEIGRKELEREKR